MFIIEVISVMDFIMLKNLMKLMKDIICKKTQQLTVCMTSKTNNTPQIF
jgi:hypothetical protein